MLYERIVTSDGSLQMLQQVVLHPKRSVSKTNHLALRVFPCARLWANEPAVLYL